MCVQLAATTQGRNFVVFFFCAVLLLFSPFLPFLSTSSSLMLSIPPSPFLSFSRNASTSHSLFHYISSHVSLLLSTHLCLPLSLSIFLVLSLFLYPHLSLSTYSISLPLSVDMDLIIFVTSSVSDWPSGLLAVCVCV